MIDGKNGVLVPFFDVEQWSDRVVDVLRHPERYRPMREAARRFVKQTFDADKICVPRMISVLRGDESIVAPRRPKGFWPGKMRKSMEASDCSGIRRKGIKT
jgi:hypothetical protein